MGQRYARAPLEFISCISLRPLVRVGPSSDSQPSLNILKFRLRQLHMERGGLRLFNIQLETYTLTNTSDRLDPRYMRC